MTLTAHEKEKRWILSERVKTLLTKDAPRDAKWHAKVAQLVLDVAEECAPRVLGKAPGREGHTIREFLQHLADEHPDPTADRLRRRLREELIEYVQYRAGDEKRGMVIGADHSVCAALGRMVTSPHGFENTSRGVAQMAEALLATLERRGHVTMPRWLEDAESLGKPG